MTGPIHIHIHVDSSSGSTEPDPQIAEILSVVNRIEGKVDTVATDLSALTAKVEENASVDQAAIELLNGLKAKLDEAIASDDPAAVQALADQLGSSSAALAAAVAANTPSSGEPAPEEPSVPDEPAPVDPEQPPLAPNGETPIPDPGTPAEPVVEPAPEPADGSGEGGVVFR